MKFTAAAIAAFAISGASAWKNGTWVTTEIVQSYTTYCPEATHLTHGNHTYTVTAPGTVTITDCPCTITRPVTTSEYVSCETSSLVTVATETPCETETAVETTAPAVETTTAVAPSNTTVPVHAGAGKAVAGLAGVIGIAALAL